MQVRCKEVRRADHMHFPSQESNIASEATRGSSPGICYSIEIKGAYLPPWAISSICDVLKSDGTSFEARYLIFPIVFTFNVSNHVNHEYNSSSVSRANVFFFKVERMTRASAETTVILQLWLYIGYHALLICHSKKLIEILWENLVAVALFPLFVHLLAGCLTCSFM